jgi:hypothetical protein
LLVTKSYVDNLQPNLSNYLTINNVYIPPVSSDLIVVEVPDPDGNKLIPKKYLDSVMPDLSSLLRINDTAAIADRGHYLSSYDVYNYNNEFHPEHCPLSTSGISNDR